MIILDNDSTFKSLIQSFETNKKIAVFMGSGASNFLGIGTWGKILSDMAKYFKCNLDINTLIENNEYAKCASLLYEEIGDEIKYKDYLANQFKPTKGYNSSLHHTILNIFKIILTTNFDTSFEDTHEQINQTLLARRHPIEAFGVQKLPDFKYDEILLQPTLVYLHGNKDDKVFVFREEEYKHFYPTNYNNSNKISELEVFLRQIIKEYTLVFIGFSFNDNDFVKFFKQIVNTEKLNQINEFESLYKLSYPKRPDPKYFVILSKNDIKLEFTKIELNEYFEFNPITSEKILDKVSKDKFAPKENADVILDSINIDEGERRKIIRFLNDYKQNLNRISFFNDLDFNLYYFKDKNYNEIEQMLRKLFKQLQKPKIGKPEDAAFA